MVGRVLGINRESRNGSTLPFSRGKQSNVYSIKINPLTKMTSKYTYVKYSKKGVHRQLFVFHRSPFI